MPRNAEETRPAVGVGSALVLTVGGITRQPQIAQSVIGPQAIYVVDVLIGPPTVREEPDNPVCEVVDSIDGDQFVAARTHAAG
jgi:hypothetical protein